MSTAMVCRRGDGTGRRRCGPVLGLLLWGGGLSPCLALEFGNNLQVHGFFSQGYLLSSHNDFFGNSSDGSFDYTETAINASWRATASLQLAGQILYRQAGETDEKGLRLDYGFVDWTVYSDNLNRWGVRLGRITNPAGFYNDARDVVFTRPSILLPQSIYFDTARIFALAGDGLSLYGERRNDWGDLILQANVVRLQGDDPGLEAAVFVGRAQGEFDPEVSFVGRLLYERDGGRLRLGLSRAIANLDYEPDFPVQLRPGSFRFSSWTLSGQYTTERWTFTGEYALRSDRFEDFGPLLPDRTVDGSAWYLQAAYRINPDWEALLRYDVNYRDDDDRSGEDFADATGLPAHLRFAKDWTFGLTWQVSPSVQVRAEYHRVDGTAWLSPLENPDLDRTERRWDLFALMASFRF